jgi:hypothetical protein
MIRAQQEISMKVIAHLFAILFLCAAAFAQDEAKAPAAADQKLFASAQQSPEMKKFVDTFAGRWRVTMKVYKGDWFPQDGTATGVGDLQAGPAGNSVAESVRSNGASGNFAGRGLYWYDKQAGAYTGIWCDSMDPNGCGTVGKGKFDGNNFVFDNVIDMGTTKMHIRQTFSNFTPNSHDVLMEAGMGDGPMKKMMEMHYERASGGRGMDAAKQK